VCVLYLQVIEVLRKPEPAKQQSARREAVKAAIDSAKKADDDRSAGDDETGLDPIDIQMVIAGACEGDRKCTRSAVSSYLVSLVWLLAHEHSESLLDFR
jgi:hypothetical protein